MLLYARCKSLGVLEAKCLTKALCVEALRVTLAAFHKFSNAHCSVLVVHSSTQTKPKLALGGQRWTSAKEFQALVGSMYVRVRGGKEGQDDSSGGSSPHGEGEASVLFLNILLSEKL